MKVERISISLEKNVFEEMEKLRGLVKRSTFINGKLKEGMNMEGC